jgi:hypothetical protein
MSKRPLNIKRAKKLRRLIKATSPIGYIDLVQWLQDHGHAQTAGEARDLIQVGNVMADSHPLGMKEIHEAPHFDGPGRMPTLRLTGRPLIPAGLRGRIRVTPFPH